MGELEEVQKERVNGLARLKRIGQSAENYYWSAHSGEFLIIDKERIEKEEKRLREEMKMKNKKIEKMDARIKTLESNNVLSTSLSGMQQTLSTEADAMVLALQTQITQMKSAYDQ